jgi:hypothetical protein
MRNAMRHRIAIALEQQFEVRFLMTQVASSGLARRLTHPMQA